MSPWCRGSQRSSLHARESCPREQIHLPGDGRRGARSLPRVQVGGKGEGLMSLTAMATAQSQGAATFPPRTHPRLMQPTRVGRIGPLPRGGSPEFTVRQSVAISTGLRRCQSVRPPRHRSTPAPPRARSCDVCARARRCRSPGPAPARGRRVSAPRVRHRRAPPFTSSPRAACDRRRRWATALPLSASGPQG